jgi:hypothetical protein
VRRATGITVGLNRFYLPEIYFTRWANEPIESAPEQCVVEGVIPVEGNEATKGFLSEVTDVSAGVVVLDTDKTVSDASGIVTKSLEKNASEELLIQVTLEADRYV